MQNNIFNFLNQIYYKGTKLKYDKKVAGSYMLSLWLSHDRKLISIVNEINHYQFLYPDEMIYKYYFDRVPKGKRNIRWTKKNAVDKKLKKKIEAIKEEYNVSTNEAKGIINHQESLK